MRGKGSGSPLCNAFLCLQDTCTPLILCIPPDDDDNDNHDGDDGDDDDDDDEVYKTPVQPSSNALDNSSVH